MRRAWVILLVVVLGVAALDGQSVVSLRGTFRTQPPPPLVPPATPNTPSPATGTTEHPNSLTLTCAASGATSFQLKFDTVNPPVTVAATSASCSFARSSLSNDQTYYWQITASNADGATPGPVWSFATAQGSTSTPLIDNTRPRLWLVGDAYTGDGQTISEVRTRLASQNAAKLETHITTLDSLYATATTDGESSGLQVSYAFLYALNAGSGNPIAGTTPALASLDYGTKAKEIALAKIAATSGIATLADTCVVYDWTYDLWSAGEKTTFRTEVQQLQNNSWNYEFVDHGDMTPASREVICGLALSEGATDALAIQMYGRMNDLSPELLGDLYDGWAPDGGYMAGSSYKVHSKWLGLINYFEMTEAWRTANGISRATTYNTAGKKGAIRYTPLNFLHWNHPMGSGVNNVVRYKTQKSEPAETANTGDADPLLGWTRIYSGIDNTMVDLAEWLLANVSGGYNGSDSQSQWDIVKGEFLWPRGTAQSPTALGIATSTFFSRIGQLVGRTAWNDTTATAFVFESPEYAHGGGYDTFAGQFQIARSGPLFLRAGFAAHDGFSQSIWATNGMYFPDTSYPERVRVENGVGTVSCTGTACTMSSAGHGLSNPSGNTASAIAIQCATSPMVDQQIIRRVTNVSGTSVTLASAFSTAEGQIYCPAVSALNWDRYTDPIPPTLSGSTAWDMGGQRNAGWGADLVRSSEFTTAHARYLGGMTRRNLRTATLDYDYGFSLNTKWYNATGSTDGQNTAKVTSYTRQFLSWGRPGGGATTDCFVTYDRVTVPNVTFEKRLALHGPGPNGTQTVVSGTETLTREGRWTYSGDNSLITVDSNESGNNFQGKGFAKILLPAEANRTVTKIGGVGVRVNDVTATQACRSEGHANEDPYGRQSTECKGIGSWQNVYGGNYRVEVRHNADVAENFLVVYETGLRSTMSAMSTTALVTGTNFEGAQACGTRIAMFSNVTGVTETATGTNADRTSGTIILPSNASQVTYKVLISDITGVRTITGGANITSITAVNGGGSSPFTATSQKQIYLNVTVSANGTDGQRTLTIS